MEAIFEFHPEARELTAPPENPADGTDSFLVNKEGVVGNGYPPHFNPLHPRNQAWYQGMIGEFVDQYKDSPALSGVDLRLMTWQNPCLNNFHSLDWGYDDFTIGRFIKDTGLPVPGEATDPQRFGKRYAWLMANARDRWITWRCEQIAKLYMQMRDRVRKARPDLLLYTGTMSREAGIDPTLLARLDGVCVVNGAVYGRRPDMRPVENRDLFMQSIRDAARKPDGQSAFLFGSQYFEATEVVLTPDSLGFPTGTPRTWMSGVVNPAGRHYLERWALALAEDDATFLADGGNAYTLGQPLLREFLNDYRRLPNQAFTSRPDAVDPVTVREYRDAKAYYCYAVNRERFPATVVFDFTGRGELTRLATGTPVRLDDGKLTITLRPYELYTLQGPATRTLKRVSVTIPEAETNRIRAQVDWLVAYQARVASGQAGERLLPNEVSLLRSRATEAKDALRNGQVWKARILLEQGMISLYEHANAYPPYLRDNGMTAPPPGAFTARELLPRVDGQVDAKLAPSTTISTDWPDDEVLITEAPKLSFTVDVPVTGRYRLTIGHAAGGDYGAVEVSVNGTSLGTMGSSVASPQGVVTLLPKLAQLQQGKATITFSRTAGSKTAIGYLQLTPIYDDVLALRWMRIGPFPAPNKEITDSMAHPLPPEEQRDFTAPVQSANGSTLQWETGQGFVDFINLSGGRQPVPGAISYAVTHVYAPSERQVRISYSMDYWIKIWLNGQLIKDYEPHAGGAPVKGQFQLTTTLHAGWNELLVKVASGSMGSGFWLAITNPGDLRFSAQGEAR
jgi:hypothetical protein